MKIVILFFLILPFISSGQFVEPSPKRPEDSVAYYKSQLRQMQRHVYDSLRQSAEFKFAVARINAFARNSDTYTAFMIFGGMVHNQYSSMNAALGQDGFSSLKSYSQSFGLGMSLKNKRSHLDISFFNVGNSSSAKKGDETIKVTLSNVLQFD